MKNLVKRFREWMKELEEKLSPLWPSPEPVPVPVRNKKNRR